MLCKKRTIALHLNIAYIFSLLDLLVRDIFFDVPQDTVY